MAAATSSKTSRPLTGPKTAYTGTTLSYIQTYIHIYIHIRTHEFVQLREIILISTYIHRYPTKYGYGHPLSVIEVFKQCVDDINSEYLTGICTELLQMNPLTRYSIQCIEIANQTTTTTITTTITNTSSSSSSSGSSSCC